MAFDNIVIPDEIQGSYFEDPSLSIPTAQDMGLTDLLLPNIGGPSLQGPDDPIKNSLDLFENKPASASTLATPKFFDYEASQADRYVNSKNFGQLGFDPALGQENEYKYGALQTWGDVWSNGLTGMFKLAGNTFIEGWKGWGNLVDAIASTSWSEAKQDLVGTPEELMAADKETKDILNKYAIFSTPESEEGVFNRKFFGDMLQQSGFAVGAISQFLSEELLTMGLSTQFSLTKLGLKAPTWLGKVVTKADVAADIVKLGNPVWKSRSISEGLVQGARQLIPYADSVYTMTKYGKAGAGALQIASIGLGGLRRTLAEANMAFTEARMESAGTYGELYTKLYDEELNRTGEAPSAEKIEAMKRTAMDAAQDNFKINSGILMLSNRLQFDNMFSKFGVGRGVFGTAGEYADDVLKVTARKTGQQTVEDITKIYAKGRLGTMGILGDIAKDFGKRTAAWEATKSFGRNIFKWETSEGIQELLQEGSNKALQDYYYDLYHGVKGADFTSYVEKAASEQYSNQGLKTFLMGALTGRLLSPINFVTGQAKYYGGTTQAQRKAREADIIESVNVINAFYTNPNLFLNEHIANVKVQDKAAKNMEEAIKNRDKYEYSNNKDGAFAKLMSTAMKTDMYKAVTDTIREYGENLNDTDFKEAFGIDKTEENVSSVKDFFGKIADETEAFQQTWKDLRDKYGDSVLVDIYKEGSPERETALLAKKVLDDAIEILATNNYKATRNAQRATALQNEVAAIPVFGSSAAAGFRVAGVIENTQKEIDLLKNEIAGIESMEKLDKSAKDLLKIKKQQLKALTMWNDNYQALEKKGMKEKRKFKKALTAFAAYMTSKNAESGISQELKIDDVQDIYDKLVDYIQLNKDSKDYIDAYNVLANPINFVKTHRRLLDAADEARKKLNAEHLQEVLNALENKNPTDKKDPEDKEVPPAFDKYMTDAYDAQVSAGSTDLPYDEWLKTPVAATFAELYNKKYGTTETLDQKKADLKTRLTELKNDILAAELTPEFMTQVFTRFSEILNMTDDQVTKLYEDFHNTLDPKELEKKLIEAGLRRNSPEEEVFNTISKVVLPLFIDDLVKEKTSERDNKGNIIDPKDNYEVIELPGLKISMNKPALKPGEKLVDNGKLGVFIIDAGKDGFMLVTSDRTNPFGDSVTVFYLTKAEAEAGRDKAIAQRDAQFKKDRSYFVFDGQEIRAGLVMVRKSDGKRFVVTNKGEAFVPRDKDGNIKKDEDGNDIPPSIKLRLLRNKTSTDTAIIVSNLNDFEIKQKVETKDTGEPVDNSVFRLYRNDELSRIYPHVDPTVVSATPVSTDAKKAELKYSIEQLEKDLNSKVDDLVKKGASIEEAKKIAYDEFPKKDKEALEKLKAELTSLESETTSTGGGTKQEAAQKRLDNILKTTPPEELASNITIRIKENPGVRSEKQAGGKGTEGKKPNPNLIQLGEKYQIQILFKGQPIGYLTNYDHFRVLSEGGLPVSIPNLTLNQFRTIFDSKGKDAWNQMQEFKSNYEQSRKVQAALAKFVKPGQEVEISSEELSKILRFNVSSGEFDYIDNGVSYLELPYNTINGFYYIIDRSRRYTKGYNFKTTSLAITNARGQDLKKIEKEIEVAKATTDPTEQLGRYVVVTKLPNGKIKFLELKTDILPADQLNDFITQLNERSKITKEQNTEVGLNDKKEKTPIRKKLDFNEALNSELASKLFISVPQQHKGTYVIFSLSDTGNLELVFLKKVGNEDIKRKITISGKTLFDPVEFKDIDDLIDQINKKIEEHDSNKAIASIAKLQIGFKLTRENFKQSTPDVSRYEELKFLKTDVSPDMIKNVRLTVKSVEQVAPVTPPSAPGSNPPTNPPSNPESATSQAKNKNNAGVPIDPVLQAQFFNMIGMTPPTQGGTDPSQMSNLQKLYKELDGLKRDKELEAVKIREEKIASGARVAAAYREANEEASIKFDKKIKEVQTKINEEKNIGKGTALKVVDKPNFDQISVINIDKFKRYVNRILGDNVSVEEIEVMVDRLKQNNITVGRFVAYLDQVQGGAPKVKGRIEVGADSPFKYHEAFHAVFRLMLTDKEIEKYLGYAKLEVKKLLEQKKTTLKAELDNMRTLHTMYESMTDAELEERYYEEYLADKFDGWKLDQEIDNVFKSKLEKIYNNGFKERPDHKSWYVKHHLDVVQKIVNDLYRKHGGDKTILDLMVYTHDLAKAMNNETKSHRETITPVLKEMGIADDVIDTVVSNVEMMDRVKKENLANVPIEVKILSTADALSHYTTGKKGFLNIFSNETSSASMDSIKESNEKKLAKDKRKILLPGFSLDDTKISYDGRTTSVSGSVTNYLNGLSKASVETKDRGILPGIRGLFQKFWNFITSFFKRFSKGDIEGLFKEIDRGKYRNSKIRENRFTKPNALSITEPALKAIRVGSIDVQDENGMYITIPKYLPQQEGDKIVSTVASMFHTRALSMVKHNKKEVLNGIFDDFFDMYNPNGSRASFYDEEIQKLYNEDPALAEEYIKKLDERFLIFSEKENRDELIKAVESHLQLMGFKQELESDEYEEMEDENGSRYTVDNWKETHSIGGFGSLSQFLRQYIATTTYVVDKDEFGNTQFVNGEPLIEAVNATTVYNGVLKAVSNITDQRKFVNRLLEMKNDNTETGKFLNKFFEDVDLEIDQKTGNFIVHNTKQATLFQMVLKGFQQYTVDYIFNNKDIRSDKKIARLYLANRMGAAKAQFTQWQNAYVSIFQTPLLRIRDKDEQYEFVKSRVSTLQDLFSDLDPEEYISDEVLEARSQMYSNGLKEELGISLSPLYIKFSIASVKKLQTDAQRKLTELFDEAEPISSQDVQQIIKSILALENPFSKNIDSLKDPNVIIITGEDEDASDADDLGEGGNITRINNMAKNNAIFDETVNTTSYKNADGELVYAHQLPTFHLVRVKDFNDQDVLDSLSEDDFLSGNILLESDDFKAMVGDFAVERQDGMKSSILTENKDGDQREDKTIQSNQNKGITYGSYSDREFLISLMDLYKYNKEYTGESGNKFLTSQHLIRVIEASNTGDTISLPIIKAVQTDEKGETTLTSFALGLLAKEVAREFERIRRVRNEITTGIYPDGEIEGYHYAVDKNDQRTKAVPRGLKFYKTRNMLGDLASELEELSKDLNFDISSRASDIASQLQKYWASKMEEIVNISDELGILTIGKDQGGNEEISNNLVDNFIYEGFTSKDGSKIIVDERMNDRTNLIPGNIRHNLGQMLVNDFINTLAFNQLLYGDEAKAFKDEVDQVKRAKGANGSGASLESYVINPELGITQAFTESFMLTFTDPKFKANFSGGLGKKADAQSYFTVKGARYTLHGLGQLTPQIAAILDKLEAGTPLTEDEIFNKNSGLTAIEGMLNSKKLVYFDGPQYIKTSTVILTKEFTSQKVDGKYVSRIGYEELHDLRERMEKFEAEKETVTFAAPKSASKGVKKNIFDHTLGFKSATDDNFIRQETKYWRLQLVNPSNKIKITDPTQAKHVIASQQDDSLIVNFRGTNISVGDLKKMYFKDTAQRLDNNYSRTRDDIFDIEDAFKELGKAIEQDKITVKLAKFQKQAIETLRSTGADSQLLEFFSLDEETGKPKYNLNNSVTLDKFTQLFLAYFSKGVMSEKVPGHSVALMSNYGVKVVKRFTGRFDENGVPIGEVVPRAVVEQDYNKYKDAKRWNNDIDRQFSGLKPGDFYVDDLRHNVPEYDANGKIIGRYTEFMMPPHFKEDMRLKPGEKIPDHILKAFGVRIPTDDLHSFISLKLVDFMPAYYGSTGVFAHELIEISGADFDIDKLYMHIYDTYVKGDKRVPYGTETSQEGKFYEFVRWNDINNKVFKERVRELKAIDPTYQKSVKKLGSLIDLQKAFKQLFDKIPESEKSIREGMQSAVLISRFIDNYIADLKDINADVYREKLGTVEEAYFAQDLEEMLSKFDAREIAWAERNYGFEMADVLKASLPKLKEINQEIKDAETVLISTALREQKLPSNIIDYNKATKTKELNNGVLNNKILEQKLTLLNNEHVTKGGNKAIAFEVSSVKLLSDLLDPEVPGNLIEILSDEDGNLPESIANIFFEGGIDVDSYIGKFKSFKNNKEGSRGIGPAVNSMLTYSVFNTFGIKLRDTYVDPKTGKTEKMYKFKLNAHEFDGYNNSSSFNFETGNYDGKDRIFSIIATIVTSMTDNAKERLAARLGLNVEAIGYVSNLVAQGVPLDASIAFMLQPVVREYFKLTKIASNNIKTNAESEIYKSQVAKKLLEKYKEEAGEDYVKADLTDEMLINNIRDEGSSAIYQASIMEEFIGVIEQSRYFSAVSQVLKLTKGLGTSFEDYDSINEKIEMLGLRVKDDKTFESFIPEGQNTPPPFDIRQILMGYDESKPYHEFMSKYIKVADQINELSKSVLIERTAPFKQLENIVKDNLNVKMSIRKKFNTDLKRDLISYLSIKAYRKYLAENNRAGTLSTMTNAMIYDEAAEAKGENFMDIIDVTRVIREKLPNNYLMQYFLNAVSTTIVDNEDNSALNPKNKDGINKLETNTWAKISEQQVEKLRDSFIEIYQSEIDFGNGRNGRDMANALFNYLLVKDGGQFKSGSFIRYIPNFMFIELLASTGKANEIMKLKRTATNSAAIDEEYRKVFGMTALEMSNEFMKIYTTHVGNGPYVKVIKMKNAPKFDKTGNSEVDDFEPSSITYTKEGGISIDIFRGARKGKSTKAMTEEEEAGAVFMDDAEYYDFIAGLSDEQKFEMEETKVKSKEYSSDEKARFSKNMRDLEAKGFYKNKKGEVVFPYIIRVKSGEMFVGDSYYILRTVKKGRVKGKVAPGVDEKRLIQAGETIAAGVGAYYEPVVRKGSRKSFKAGEMFDPIPEIGKLRKYRKITNDSGDYNPFYQTSSDDPIKEENWLRSRGFTEEADALSRKAEQAKKEAKAAQDANNAKPPVKPISTGGKTPKDILLEFGITMQLVPGKGIVYGGSFEEIFPADMRSTLRTPMDIVQALGITPETSLPNVRTSETSEPVDPETPESKTPSVTFPTSKIAMEGVSDPKLREEMMKLMFGNNNPLQDDCAKG